MRCRKCKKEIADDSAFCSYCGAKQRLARSPKKRGNGTGSVYQLPNKSWIAIKTVVVTADGGKIKRTTRSKSGFKTKRDALEYLSQLDNAPRKKKTTLKDLYEAWLPTHRAGKDTLNCYKAAWKHYAPIYGMDIDDITVDELQDCIDDCPHGKRTKQNMKTLCGLLYKYAIPRKLATLNMGEYLKVTGESGTKDGLPIEYVEKLKEHIFDVTGADIVYCQCYLGFRPSELLSLKSTDYDATEKAFTGGAKTDAGKDRIVTVSPKILPIVERRSAHNYVFSLDGKQMPIKAYRDLFYGVLEQCGCDNPIETVNGTDRHKYTPHSCRHTFATLLKRVDGADKDKLELIGHTSDEMLRHYQDVTISDLRKITDLI